MKSRIVLAFCLLAASAPAWGQAIPSNPALNPDRINEEQRRRLEDLSRAPDNAPSGTLVEPPQAAPAAPEAAPAVRFTLERVTFDRSDYLTPDDLETLAKPLIGREIGIADLRALIDGVNALYTRRGVVTARAVLPPQQIAGGVVHIGLVEGRVGAVSVTGARRDADRIRNAGPQAGELADAKTLERTLKRYNMGHDAQLSARLAQGTAVGTTDVEIVTREPPRITADAFVDNAGFPSTGAWELGGVARAYRLIDPADRLALSYIHSRGVDSGSAEYSLPILAGVRGALNVSSGRTALVTGANRDVRILGSSTSIGGSATGILLVRQRTTLALTATVQRTRSTTDVAGVRVLDNRLIRADVGLAFARDTPGLNLFAQIEGSLAELSEAVFGVHRAPFLVTGAFGVTKGLGSRGFFARIRADGQFSGESDLPGLLQYQVGGARTARAFDPGVAAGDDGVSASGELGYAHDFGGRSFEVFAFVDDAQVYGPGAPVSLQSAGVGLNAGLGSRLSLRASFAESIDHHGLGDGSHRGFLTAIFHL